MASLVRSTALVVTDNPASSSICWRPCSKGAWWPTTASMRRTPQEALKHFNPAGGSVINLSSVVSNWTPPNGSVYSATKAAVDAVTGSLAKELGARKIRVNAVRPGMVETEGTRTAGITESDMRKQYEAQASLGRIAQPQDIATAVAFLASSDSSWITGETLLISGGF